MRVEESSEHRGIAPYSPISRQKDDGALVITGDCCWQRQEPSPSTEGPTMASDDCEYVRTTMWPEHRLGQTCTTCEPVSHSYSWALLLLRGIHPRQHHCMQRAHGPGDRPTGRGRGVCVCTVITAEKSELSPLCMHACAWQKDSPTRTRMASQGTGSQAASIASARTARSSAD